MPTAQAATLLARAPTPWCDSDTDGFALELEERGPEFPSHFVRRPALVERIRRDTAGLALLIAPPGYGKTSLLSEWAEYDERPFLWLVIEPRGSSQTAELTFSAPDWPPSLGSACVAVLDDAHLLTPAALRTVVEGVLGDLPPGSVLALASRSELQLPMGRLRAHRAVTELRTGDFAMTPTEAAEMLRMAGGALDAAVVEELVKQTHGWPAALYLAGLSLRSHGDGEGFKGSDHLVSEYLGDEVLSALPAELIAFAQRASVLDELSGQVCDSVLDQRRTGRKLALLARSSQLLEPVDAAHDRYRWHPLIKECLTGELHRVEPELELELHRRASGWFAQRGDIPRAIEHACAAGDAEQAGDLIWSNILRYVTTGHAGLVLRWLESFGDEEIRRDARLAMCAALACVATGDLGQTQHWARCAETAGGGPSFSAGLAVIKAMGARGGAAMRALAHNAYEAEPPASEWRAVSLALRGIAEHLIGDRDAAIGSLEEATDLAGSNLPALAALSMAQRAMIAIEQGEWPIASDLTDAAIDTVREHHLADDPLMALVFAATAACRAHEGRSDEAKRDLRAGIGGLAAFGDTVVWYAAEARVLLAHASLWLADVVGARTLLAQASRIARRTEDAKALEPWFDEAWAYMDTLAETSLLGPSALTIAELRILRFLPTHRSFREIAGQLGVSANTVKTQAHAIYRKLGVASRSEAVESAVAAGLLGQ
jgi:LuxR family transcriptional regulator, maltose regulon positive regulatory protein